MKDAIIQGLFTGLIISTFTGPIFFLLVDLGIRGQMKAGVNLALGTFASDLLTVIFVYFVAASIVANQTVMEALYLIGGIILIVIGLKQIFKQSKAEEEHPPALTSKEKRKLFLKGFLVNSSNPNVFLFWLGAVMIAIQTYGNKLPFILGHFMVALSLVLITDCLKMYLAARLRPLLKGNTLQYIGKIGGMIIVFFGVKLMFFH